MTPDRLILRDWLRARADPENPHYGMTAKDADDAMWMVDKLIAEEREACAKVADYFTALALTPQMCEGAKLVAQSIRARGKP